MAQHLVADQKKFPLPRVLSEIIKILARGQAYDIFSFLYQENYLAILYPALEKWLQNTYFNGWFFAILKKTDLMVKEKREYGTPSRFYLIAVYLIAKVLEENAENIRNNKEVHYENIINRILLEYSGFAGTQKAVADLLRSFFIKFKNQQLYTCAPSESIFGPLRRFLPHFSVNTSWSKLCQTFNSLKITSESSCSEKENLKPT
jgi:tRNA nucleotidyltransferase/poly(A) polymerase